MTEDIYEEGDWITNVHYRFQVIHDLEGYIAGYNRRDDALERARSWFEHQRGYETEPEVYDSMAHRGCPDLYAMDGTVLRRRGR